MSEFHFTLKVHVHAIMFVYLYPHRPGTITRASTACPPTWMWWTMPSWEPTLTRVSMATRQLTASPWSTTPWTRPAQKCWMTTRKLLDGLGLGLVLSLVIGLPRSHLNRDDLFLEIKDWDSCACCVIELAGLTLHHVTTESFLAMTTFDYGFLNPNANDKVADFSHYSGCMRANAGVIMHWAHRDDIWKCYALYKN